MLNLQDHASPVLPTVAGATEPSTATLQECIRTYRNEAGCNTAVFADFTRRTDAILFLKSHRDLIERNQWGHGERAFHYLWYLVLRELSAGGDRVCCCEIGVYKGQVISLWSRLAAEFGVTARITAISPFEGNFTENDGRWSLLRRLIDRISPRRRELSRAGSLYPREDYLATVQRVFAANGLDSESVTYLKGYSQEENVLAQLRGKQFDLLYIDGDHTYAAVRADIEQYVPLVRDGGYLVMDDAACDLPGSGYFKGYPSVTRACELLPDLGFRNVLNVGHNRLYQKQNRAR